ncbi:hypothetical protein ETB97_001335 [Aspergillus alliaceus]|uniref:DoxX family protein n=1 Tax=Petromyces alliaceus TaxID=209559 RepID=A0A8H6A4V6_PETAA|nr:hypothetical protein ETB97_001335 [Aspergillus burnettii]
MSSSLWSLPIYLLSGVGFLGALSRFTHGKYTPEWYAFQEYHSPDDGSIVAIITPFIDTAMGLMLLFGAHTLRLSAANRLPAANISLVFFTMGLLIQVSAEKDYVGDVALVGLAALAVVGLLRR